MKILLIFMFGVVLLLGIILYNSQAQKNIKQLDRDTIGMEEMKIDEKISTQWERLFEYYQDVLVKTCEGASDKEIEAVELELEITFPKELADSFKLCNERYKFNNGTQGWFGTHEHYALNKTYVGYYNLLEINKELRAYNEEWNKNWVAFYDYETWFQALIDTKTEKVYCYSSETGKLVLWANSYEEWLKLSVNEVIKYGEIRLGSIQKLMKIADDSK